MGAKNNLDDENLTDFFSDIRDVVREDLFSWDRVKKIVKINFHDYGFLDASVYNKDQPRVSRFYSSLQQKASLSNLPYFDRKKWDRGWRERWRGYNITQSISISWKRKKINKISLPVSDIGIYSWSLYDGDTKIHEDSYTTNKDHSFHTFTLPQAMIADRLVLVVEKGGGSRRLARPILE